MADARLVATNPDDSSLVPVACTSAGLLKTEPKGEGPQGPKGDPGDQGPPGPKGDPGTDGTGVPSTIGVDDGSVLTFKDGVIQWASAPAPIPSSWINGTICETGTWTAGADAAKMYDGLGTTQAQCADPSSAIKIIFPVTYNTVIIEIVTANQDAGADYEYELNGVSGTMTDTGYGGNWMNLLRLNGNGAAAGSILTINRQTNTHKTGIAMMRINNTIITEP